MEQLIFNIFKKVSTKLRGSGLGKFPFVMDFYKFIVSKTSPKRIEIDGIVYFLDNQDSLGLSVFGVNDETQTNLIKRTIKKDWNVIDVGAHIGYYSMLYAKLVGKKGRVFSFEPARDTFKLLTTNIAANNFTQVTAENYAVAEKNKKISFSVSSDPLTNKIVNQFTQGSYYQIRAISLDDYFKSFKKPIHFVKIDVEGAEYSVLQGMKMIIRKNKNIKLLIEFCPQHLEEYNQSGKKLLDLLQKFGFIFYDVSDKSKNTTLVSKSYLLKEYKKGITNILCVKK